MKRFAKDEGHTAPSPSRKSPFLAALLRRRPSPSVVLWEHAVEQGSYDFFSSGSHLLTPSNCKRRSSSGPRSSFPKSNRSALTLRVIASRRIHIQHGLRRAAL